MRLISILAAGVLSFAPLASSMASPPADITVTTEDGVTVHGTTYFGELPKTAPLIALFHQGGSNGRGEYQPLIGWLNENGFRAIAWDLRKGGDLYGALNRTAKGREEMEEGYCDAWPDMAAAVRSSLDMAGSAPLVLWGSSYSGSLVFKVAAETQGADAVIAFSPASGGPMAKCRAALYLRSLTMPALVLRPMSEMARDSSQQQRLVLEAFGVDFEVIENGVHGSSMLVDERTEHDMTAARALVMEWLQTAAAPSE